MRPHTRRLLHDSLLASAADRADHVAVITEAERVTYAQLHERAARFARALQDRGLRRGERVAIYLENGVPTVVAIYGALLAGGAFVVMNPQTKADKLAYMLRDCEASVVVTDPRLAQVVASVAPQTPSLRTLVQVGGEPVDLAGAVAYDELLAKAEPAPRPAGVIPNDLAALVYTSGSTGHPKGVMLSHANMTFAQGSLVEYLRLGPDDRILDVLPLAFDYGLYQALMAVHLGATLVLETSFAFPARVIQRVQEEGVTVFPGVPTVFATLLSLHRQRPVAMPTVRRLTNTAAHLPDEYVPGLLEMCPDALVFKMYGLTECKRVCYLEPELVRAKPSSVGRAIPGTEVMVLDDAGAPVPPGVTGTLYVRGPHVMMGYWNLPDETAHMLKPGPWPGERMLCTHDLFKTDADGFLYFVGRSDDIIKSRGEKVSPVEVENALSTIDGVKEVCVVGVPDDLLGQAVRAFVVLDPGAQLDERSFKRAAMALLENFMVPRDVVFLDELPKTGSGKVRRKSLIEGASA